MKALKHLRLFDTYGRIAIASLFVCGLTGFLLIVPFNPAKAYTSVTAFVTANPAASFTRNIHYWSAQLFLIFTILHFIDHYRSGILVNGRKDGKRGKITPGIWFRLVFSVLVVFYVMLSGFILKDDADSRQASLLLNSLLKSIPMAGEFLSTALTGKAGSLLVIYLHHAATATIIIFIVVFEHVRDFRVKWQTFIYSTLFILLLSLFFRAPLSQPDEAVMKGPWYFVGVQEMLHQFANPLVVVIILLSVLLVVYLVPFLKDRIQRLSSQLIWVFFIIYILLSLTGYFLRGHFYEFQVPFTDSYHKPVTIELRPIHNPANKDLPLVEVNGRIEGCMSCHKGMKGLSISHDPAIIGCFSCHGGDPYTLNAGAAHKGMFTVPGNLNNSEATCGRSGCHEDIIERLPTSMMASLNGMISVDKWVFNENPTPDGNFHVNKIRNTPADIHLKNLCAGCHLGMEKTNHGNPGWLDRGGGCNACHLTYNTDDLQSLALIKKMKAGESDNKLTGLTHPKIDLNITNDKCESCHSRSGRISMSYAGWHETDLKTIPEDKELYRKLPDGRIFIKQPADVHHEAGLLCIDCHGSFELMGDGKKYNHKEEAVKITCQDCHSSTPLNGSEKLLSETDRETQLIAWVRGWSDNNPTVVTTQKDNRPIVNAWYDKGQSERIMISKATGKRHELKASLPQCINDNAHKRLSCESCHTAWVPQCIGCHNMYEKETEGYDMLKRQKRKGTWVEFSGEPMADAPVLGIKSAGHNYENEQVSIFSPGMIMTIDHSGISKPGSSTFHRLFAPVSGHTTRRESRTCVSCHLNPLALGFGRGTLELNSDGSWLYEPAYENNKNDNLPEDAWIGFLKERTGQSVTRSNMRPFNLIEQRRILKAGACLKCHDEKSIVIQTSLHDFDKAIKSASSKCIIPN